MALLRKTQVLLRRLSTTTLNGSRIQAGDKLPDVDLFEGTPQNKVNVAELYSGKKGILFSVVGAFTPGCTKSHLPEFLEHSAVFKNAGYDVISCVCVNDPFVMGAWSKSVHAEGKIRMLADTHREFTKAIGMELDCTPLLGNIRSLRYFMLIEDGVVSHVTTGPDTTGLACLLCIKTMGEKADKEFKKESGS